MPEFPFKHTFRGLMSGSFLKIYSDNKEADIPTEKSVNSSDTVSFSDVLMV